ncbi:MAG: hypothetical protein A2Z24_02950 [Candidatus Woykebacteria bacterium RBG_16_44_10]|uniref:PsbP C-terminal domain-containing protein n=1 Tax=Candidatus Woykebacteria bacterium RBG_16_44_10 TaxID=1802597 RepID=A0A1G1WCK7_9BACT|nr:MAG: hypothetical protein A2Z24_02950 [Candidatus Woykebacteria bacterium RBG_16_44_10]
MPEQVNPVTPQQPTVAVATPKNPINWKNIIIGVVIGAIIVGIGVAIYLLLQPKPEEPTSPTNPKTATTAAKPKPEPPKITDETAGWKTYTDPTRKITFKYPKEWVVRTKSNDPTCYEELINVAPEGYQGKCTSIIFISMVFNKKDIGCDQSKVEDLSISQVENTIINGKPVIRCVSTDTSSGGALQQGTKTIDVYFKNENLVISYAQSPGQASFINEFESLLSTFKFLD